MDLTSSCIYDCQFGGVRKTPILAGKLGRSLQQKRALGITEVKTKSILGWSNSIYQTVEVKKSHYKNAVDRHSRRRWYRWSLRCGISTSSWSFGTG